MSILHLRIKKVSEDDEVIVFSYVDIIREHEETEGIIHFNKVKRILCIAKPCSNDCLMPSYAREGKKEYFYGEAATIFICGRLSRGEPLDEFTVIG